MQETGISAIIGLILPPVIDLIRTKTSLSGKGAYWLSIIASAAVGAGISAYDGLLINDPTLLLANIGVIFATSQTVYNQYWKDSEARKKIV